MQEKLDKVLDKLDSQGNRLTRIETRLNSIDENLAEHMRRTSLLEQRTEKLQKWSWTVAGGIALLAFMLQLLIKRL